MDPVAYIVLGGIWAALIWIASTLSDIRDDLRERHK